MVTFPFCTLPSVVKREVISSLNVIEILFFSLPSPESFKIARKVKNIETLTWSFQDDIDSDIMFTEKRGQSYCTILLPKPERLAERREEVLEGRDYSEVFFPTTIRGIPIFISKMKAFELTLIKLFSEHCIGLRIQEYDVHLDAFAPPITDCFIFNLTKEMNSLSVAREEALTTEDFNFMFGDIKYKETSLSGQLPRDHGYIGPLKVDQIRRWRDGTSRELMEHGRPSTLDRWTRG